MRNPAMLSPRSSASPVLGPKAPKYGYHRLIGSWTPATLAIHSRMNTRTIIPVHVSVSKVPGGVKLSLH